MASSTDPLKDSLTFHKIRQLPYFLWDWVVDQTLAVPNLMTPAVQGLYSSAFFFDNDRSGHSLEKNSGPIFTITADSDIQNVRKYRNILIYFERIGDQHYSSAKPIIVLWFFVRDVKYSSHLQNEVSGSASLSNASQKVKPFMSRINEHFRSWKILSPISYLLVIFQILGQS